MPRSELRKVVNVVRRFGLGFPEVSFKLVSDNREIFHLFPEILERRIDHLLDPTLLKAFITNYFGEEIMFYQVSWEV